MNPPGQRPPQAPRENHKGMNAAMDLYNNDTDQYPDFEASIKERFNSVVENGIPLFTTDVDGLFDIYLSNLPAEARQHYICNACRHFVNRYGGLVAISESGEMIPVMWNESVAPMFFHDAVEAMKTAVLKSRVNGVFITDLRTLGTPKTGEWTHMAVPVPQQMIHTSRTKAAHEVAAEKLQDYEVLGRALEDYSLTVIDKGLELLTSEVLYRGDKVRANAEWFKALKTELEGTKNTKQRANIQWLAAATAPAGFTHVRSGMLGTLLTDIKEDKSTAEIIRNFGEKMDPLQYMRPQAAPTQGNIQQAEKRVAQMGIAESLRRRYARFEEILEFLWIEKQAGGTFSEAKKPGVFSHITPKGAPAAQSNLMNLPSTTMTWTKFERTILPTAETIEVRVDNPNRLMALVTAADPTAPNILRWGNTFSWYYRRGVSYDGWNMPTSGFVKVKGITESPNQWGQGSHTYSAHHIFFLLEGCRDKSGSNGGGFFPEQLKSELHEIRATLEAYNAKTPIEGADEASACGAGYSTDNEWNLTLKVTSNNSTRLIKIDRWD